jgi:CheY-like chemotaxis protein
MRLLGGCQRRRFGKILLVEDDANLAEVTKFGLEAQGRIIQIADGGRQACDCGL